MFSKNNAFASTLDCLLSYTRVGAHHVATAEHAVLYVEDLQIFTLLQRAPHESVLLGEMGQRFRRNGTVFVLLDQVDVDAGRSDPRHGRD